MGAILGFPHNMVAAAAAAKSLQLCPTPHDPIDGSPPGSPVLGILQARVHLSATVLKYLGNKNGLMGQLYEFSEDETSGHIV